MHSKSKIVVMGFCMSMIVNFEQVIRLAQCGRGRTVIGQHVVIKVLDNYCKNLMIKRVESCQVRN